jgi:hypothetical protein
MLSTAITTIEMPKPGIAADGVGVAVTAGVAVAVAAGVAVTVGDGTGAMSGGIVGIDSIVSFVSFPDGGSGGCAKTDVDKDNAITPAITTIPITTPATAILFFFSIFFFSFFYTSILLHIFSIYKLFDNMLIFHIN